MCHPAVFKGRFRGLEGYFFWQIPQYDISNGYTSNQKQHYPALPDNYPKEKFWL
jgi:hypothetical protein